MNSSDLPLISCLCVTENRVAHLEKSIACFFSQSYSNKELLIVFPVEDLDTTAFLETQGHPIIAVPLHGSSTISLGAKRNLAIEKSNGKYFCVWDDDDWHHPDRLIRQFNALIKSNTKCCALSRILLYDGVTRAAYVSGNRQGWEGTLLCEKSLINDSFKYGDLQRGEDSVLLYELLNHNLCVAIDNPELYIYIHHGNNTWNRDHWERNLIGWGRKLSDEVSAEVEVIVNTTYINQKTHKQVYQLHTKISG